VHRRCQCTLLDPERGRKIFNFVTWNLLNYDGTDPDQAARYERLYALLVDLNPGILAVQELISSGPDGNTGDRSKRAAAENSLWQLADALGMDCVVGTKPAVSISNTRHHTGLLWAPGIEVVPGSFEPYDSDTSGMSHGMATAVFDVGGPRLRAGSAHFSHQDPGLSGGWKDAGVVHRAFHREDGIPGLVGGDWQGIGSNHQYDPHPYENVDWTPDIAYHLDLFQQPDRHAAIRLERIFRFRDCAILTDAPRHSTTGHHKTDRQPSRRIDRIYATYDLPTPAIAGFRAVEARRVGQCSDHRPVLAQIDETKLT
jgi:endonuclease/exonuclease/phosphatase family metal-dependent hydrolase